MSRLDCDPKDIFGEDLALVFGPKNERRHINTLTYKEQEEIINSVPKYLSTDSLGLYPTAFEIVNFILNTLKSSGKFKGIDLPWCEDLIKGGIVRHKSMFKAVKQIRKNNKTQRGIQLRHLLRDILFKFNKQYVLTGLARFSKKTNCFYLNDSQHRLIACIILGIREFPVEYIISELESVDAEQYHCVNINGLAASDFDKYRIRKEFWIGCLAENRDVTGFDPAYEITYNVDQIMTQYSLEVVEKNGTPSKGECTAPGLLVREYERYGEDIFSRAVSIVSSMFGNHYSGVNEQNIHMVCEFVQQQEKVNVFSNSIMLDMAIEEAILHWAPKLDRKGLYLDIQRADPYWANHGSKKEVIWAGGLLKLARVVRPDVDWNPILVNKFSDDDTEDTVDVAQDLLKDFHVMPKVSHDG
jgi:hypothetical protein